MPKSHELAHLNDNKGNVMKLLYNVNKNQRAFARSTWETEKAVFFSLLISI